MKPLKKNCQYSEGKINLVKPCGSLDGNLNSRDGRLLHLHPATLFLRLAHLPPREDGGVQALPSRHRERARIYFDFWKSFNVSFKSNLQ